MAINFEIANRFYLAVMNQKVNAKTEEAYASAKTASQELLTGNLTNSKYQKDLTTDRYCKTGETPFGEGGSVIGYLTMWLYNAVWGHDSKHNSPLQRPTDETIGPGNDEKDTEIAPQDDKIAQIMSQGEGVVV